MNHIHVSDIRSLTVIDLGGNVSTNNIIVTNGNQSYM